MYIYNICIYMYILYVYTGQVSPLPTYMCYAAYTLYFYAMTSTFFMCTLHNEGLTWDMISIMGVSLCYLGMLISIV